MFLFRPASLSADQLPQLHTDLGDIKIEIFCEAVPKTAEVLKIPLLMSILR